MTTIYFTTGINLPVDFTAGIPNSLPSSTSNGISGSITRGISTGIPGSMTTDIPANIPTLNLGQSLHHVEQLRQTQEARNPWYPTGILALYTSFTSSVSTVTYTFNATSGISRKIYRNSSESVLEFDEWRNDITRFNFGKNLSMKFFKFVI